MFSQLSWQPLHFNYDLGFELGAPFPQKHAHFGTMGLQKSNLQPFATNNSIIRNVMGLMFFT